jgi:hypothetical protein
MTMTLRALPAALILAFGLTACGGGTSSSGGGQPSVTSSSGVVVDDLVVEATVFCDGNDNGIQDDGEATATTDDSGAFTFTPACTAPIRTVVGTGYDRTLMKAPKGQLRGKAGSKVLSYFTTMQLESGLSDAQFQAVLAKLGLTGVDASTFDPTRDADRLGTAAALAKILNDLADIVEAAGGDPKEAFRTAAGAMIRHAQSQVASGTVFDGDGSALVALIQAASSAAFAAVDTSTWTSDQKANAATLASEGLAIAAAAVRGHRSYDEAHDDLNNGSVGSIISDTDLTDRDKVEEARGRCRDRSGEAEARRPQYVYADGDALAFIDGSGAARRFTLAQLDAGINLSDTTLGALRQLQLPMRATTLALPRQGQRVSLALQVEQVGGTRLLQVALDRIVLKRGSTGVITAAIPSNAKLYFYARSASGIEIGTGEAGFTDLNGDLLSTTADGLALDLQVLAQKMKGRFPTQTALLDGLLQAKGHFSVKLVVGELDLRHDGGGRFGVGRVAVAVPGSHRSAYRLNGSVVNGHVTF